MATAVVEQPKVISAKWRKLLLLVPGYDAIATAGRCEFDPKAANNAVEFIETMLTHYKGPKGGQLFLLEPWEKAIVGNLFGWKRPDGTRRYREAFIYVPRKNGKALAVDTPIPTPTGWKAIGDLIVGDVVFDADGQQTDVIAAHDVMLDRRCYQMSFSDGTSIVCDAEHLWETNTRTDQDQSSVKTTEAIYHTLLTRDVNEALRVNHSIPVTGRDVSHYQIIAVDPVESVPVRCITVANERGMFLAGRGMVPTHNSALAAAIILLIAFQDKEPGAELYSAASSSDQALMVYEQAWGMVEQESELSSRCTIYKATKTILQEGKWYYKAISSDAGKSHGKNVHAAIIDELHEQPNRDLVDAFQTSTGARRQPLIIYITTADYDRVSICNEKYDYAVRVRDRVLDNEKFFPAIYEADRDDDWTDPKVWAKANPNLGVSVSLEYLEGECKKAQEIPAYENTFRRLHLCQRTQQDTRAIPMEQWRHCGYNADPVIWRVKMLQELLGKQCAGGLDLGSVSDLTALVLLFGDDIAGYDVLPFFWCPEDTAEQRSRRDGVDYVQWGNAGFITLTSGNETDYTVVRRDINRLASQYGIYMLAVDRLFQGAQLCQNLGQDGMELEVFGQGYVSMAAPTRAILELLRGGRLRHGNNPVLSWMAANAATESDGGPAETVLKFSKKKSTEKIDGIIAMTMARGVAKEGGSQSVYDRENRGFTVIG